MLNRWSRTVVTHRRLVLVASLLFVLAGLASGMGLTDRLSNGGFTDPESESAQAARRISAEFGRPDADVVAMWSTTDGTIDQPDVRAALTAVLTRLRAQPEVAAVTSYYDNQDPAYAAPDRRATYATIQLRTAGDTDDFDAVRPLLSAPDGIDTALAGPTAVSVDVSEQVAEDVKLAELITFPLLLLVLVLVFRSIVAALTPLVVAAVSVAGSLLALRLLDRVTEVSVLAVNVVTLIGMGLAVDYALLVVSRFREELRARETVHAAVSAAVATAGRTVLFSGVTVTCALAALLICPQPYLRSMGLGGMAAVLVAMAAALTVLPALLAVLGPRSRRLRGTRHRTPADDTTWRRLATGLRRPVAAVIVAGVLALLAVLALPVRHAEFGGIDERVLRADSGSRVAAEELRTRFPQAAAQRLHVLLIGPGADDARRVADAAGRLPSVLRADVVADRADAALITVTATVTDATGPPGRAFVRAVRDLPRPPDTEMLVGGVMAEETDMIDGLADRLPWIALTVVAVTLVLLFLAFGSVVLPLKAVLLNVLSVAASLGVVVWAFQDGHLADALGFTVVGHLDARNLILMLVVLFGLSTDYEIFLLSRMRETWDRTGDHVTAVTDGLVRTGRLITSAALLLAIVLGGFATAGITSVQMLGVGMVVAIVLDATVVRALLVPAVIRLLGPATWWAPGPMVRLHRRYGIRESAPEPPPVHRHRRLAVRERR